MQNAEYEIELDATEATLSAIEEQLESDSPVMQAEGAHKVKPVLGTLPVKLVMTEVADAHRPVVDCAVSEAFQESVPLCVHGGVTSPAYCCSLA